MNETAEYLFCGLLSFRENIPMLTISVSEQTEETVRRLAMLSGVPPEDVCRVLLAIPLSPTAFSPQSSDSQYRTAPELSDDEYSALIQSLGKRVPAGTIALDGVDLRELAYADHTV